MPNVMMTFELSNLKVNLHKTKLLSLNLEQTGPGKKNIWIIFES
jgi:hypothetical protein